MLCLSQDMKNQELIKALKTLLTLADAKLNMAIALGKEWDIENYAGDVHFLNCELDILGA